MTNYVPITEISDYALLKDPLVHGPHAYYAFSAHSEGSDFVGPFTSIRDALEEFLDANDPEDDTGIEVTLGRPMTMPGLRDVAETLVDQTCSDDWCESAVDNLHRTFEGQRGDALAKSLDDAVNMAIETWFKANTKFSLEGYWRGYGKSLDTDAKSAREWLKAKETA